MLKADNITYRTLELPVPGDLKGRQALGGLKTGFLLVKRAMDLTCSTLVIGGILSWLVPVLAALIKLDSKGPIFFLQKRVGREGKVFTCYKLRTMVINPEADELPCEENDIRITRCGRVLRAAHLDELPQFFNVLTGVMSLVGPRPYMLADEQRMAALVPRHNIRNYVKPGITGMSQVKGCHDGDMDLNILFSRHQWDVFYVRHACLSMDLRIISHTIRLFFTQKIGLWR
ncbi:MAG TPA: sugar transferase [Puia sp.]